MDSITVLIIAILPLSAKGFVLNDAKWDNLRVTWGMDPFNPNNFVSMPKTEQDAMSEGWVMKSDCNAGRHFVGKRYWKDDDPSVMLLYDVNGYIAGIQIGITKDVKTWTGEDYPFQQQINAPFVDDGDLYVITAYFTDPGLNAMCQHNIGYTCWPVSMVEKEPWKKPTKTNDPREATATLSTAGRTQLDFNSHGIGEHLYIQNGTLSTEVITAPTRESEVESTGWTKGECFTSMGVFYWYNVRVDMPCSELFPVFLLYNEGELNAFGWALQTNVAGVQRLEHQPTSYLSAFMKTVPSCLDYPGTLTTLHIYMNTRYLLNKC